MRFIGFSYIKYTLFWRRYNTNEVLFYKCPGVENKF